MAASGLLTLAGGIAGAIAGFFVGGPSGAAIGFSIGAGLAAGFEEKPGIETGRISDLRVTGASYGNNVSRVYGTVPVPGSMVWTSGLIEKKDKNKEGGGLFSTGTEVTTFKYFMDVAYLLCEGEIEGVGRIWFNGELLFDGRSTASAIDKATDGKYWDSLTIYTGSETQTADPTIVSYEGAANVSAMRGMAYIVIKKLRLKQFYNKAPNIKAEVVKSNSSTTPPFIVDTLTTEVVDREAAIYEGGTVLVSDINTSGLDIKDEFNHEFSRLDLEGNVLDAWTYEIREPASTSSGQVGQCKNDPRVAIHANIVETGTNCKLYYDGVKIATEAHPSSPGGEGPLGSDDHEMYATGTAGEETIKRGYGKYYFSVVGTYSSSLKGIVRYVADSFTRPTFNWDLTKARTDLVPGYAASNNFFLQPDAESENILWVYSSDTTYRLMRCDLDLNILNYWGSAQFGDLGGQEDDLILIGPGYAMYKTAHTTTSVTLKTFDHETTNSTVTTSTVTVDNTTNYSSVIPIGNSLVMTKYEIVSRESLVVVGGQTLQSVAEDLFAGAGYDSGDYDMTSLTGTVQGFRIPSSASTRDSLQQLQLVHFFDIVEIDYQATGVMRGGSSVETISNDDMAAHNQDAEMPDILRRQRASELELPREVSLTYINRGGNYETGNQAATRQITEANKESHLSLNVVINDDEAMQSAHVILYNEHANNEELLFSLTEQHAKLVPGDIITITDDTDQIEVRITEVSENLRGVMDIVAVPEFTDIYTQAVTGAPTSTDYAAAVSQNGPAALAWLDIPLLTNNDDNLGIYTGASGYLAGWTSHELFRFVEAANNYSLMASYVDNASIGTAEAALGDFTGGTIDYTNSITVRLANTSNSLTSSTEAAVIADGSINRAVLGREGRYEVFQFITATSLGSGRYTLSGLLRGRRGTNYAIDEHENGDLFALVTVTEFERIFYELADVDADLLHKFVGRDDSIDLVTPTRQTFTGRAKLPFAPARVEASQSGSDWIVTWTPRTRLLTPILSNEAYQDDSEVATYTIDFLDGSDVVKGSYSVTVGTETKTYTSTEQTTDFGSTQSDIIVVVYQKGTTLATEGHGYKLTTSTDARAIVDPKA